MTRNVVSFVENVLATSCTYGSGGCVAMATQVGNLFAFGFFACSVVFSLLLLLYQLDQIMLKAIIMLMVMIVL